MTDADGAPTRLWVGTYPDPSGAPEGVWAVALDPSTGALGPPVLAAATPAPSFLVAAPGGRTLFAAGETSPGAVTRLTVGDDGTLTQRERVASGGASPCHLLLHPGERALYVANYASGSVGVVPLRPGPDGEPELVAGVAQVFEHSGRGPRADRQEGPHAHATTLTPDGACLLALDLGTDEVRRYRVRPDGLLDADGVAARLPYGTGPRHAAWGPGGHLYVVGELDLGVHVLRWDGERLHGVARVPLPGGADAAALAAHPIVVDDRLLVSVRGPGVLARFRLADDGARLDPDAALPVGVAGAWPRHFALVDGWAVVADQHAGRLVTLRADADAGAGAGTGTATDATVAAAVVPAPTCVAVGA